MAASIFFKNLRGVTLGFPYTPETPLQTYVSALSAAEGVPMQVVIPNWDAPLDLARGFDQVNLSLHMYAWLWALPAAPAPNG